MSLDKTSSFQHHPIFSHFSSATGHTPNGSGGNFLGAVHRGEDYNKVVVTHTVEAHDCYPAFDEEYFEWVALLESVMAAGDRYTFCELGAGYGRWSAKAYLAAKRKKISEIKLVTVEGEPSHSSWLPIYLADLSVQPHELDSHECVISDRNGVIPFCVRRPEGNSHDMSQEAKEWYGQFRLGDWDTLIEPADALVRETYYGKPITRTANGYGTIEVLQRRASDLLGQYELIDLIDMDLQGEEAIVVAEAISYLNNHVKRLHIGTHKREIEADLRKILSAHAWRCAADYPCFSISQTPYGPIEFQDGVQTWINSRELRGR